MIMVEDYEKTDNMRRIFESMSEKPINAFE